MTQKVTAILVYSLVEAISVYQAAYELNVKIPSEMSVICFNDEYPANVLAPALTGMGLPTAL